MKSCGAWRSKVVRASKRAALIPNSTDGRSMSSLEWSLEMSQIFVALNLSMTSTINSIDFSSDLHNYFLLWQNKIFLSFDRSKDHSKTKYFLGFVLVLPKQKIIVQVSFSSITQATSCIVTQSARRCAVSSRRFFSRTICNAAKCTLLRCDTAIW